MYVASIATFTKTITAADAVANVFITCSKHRHLAVVAVVAITVTVVETIVTATITTHSTTTATNTTTLTAGTDIGNCKGIWIVGLVDMDARGVLP